MLTGFVLLSQQLEGAAQVAVGAGHQGADGLPFAGTPLLRLPQALPGVVSIASLQVACAGQQGKHRAGGI